jgi:hypothetical protein
VTDASGMQMLNVKLQACSSPDLGESGGRPMFSGALLQGHRNMYDVCSFDLRDDAGPLS